MESDRLVLERSRLPSALEVGSEFSILVKGRVRRIEAEQIDVTGYTSSTSIAVLEGRVYVEFTILDVGVQ